MTNGLSDFNPSCGCMGTGWLMPDLKGSYPCPTHSPEMFAHSEEWPGVEHPQALMLTKDLKCTWVDELMVPILEYLYNDGYTTYYSCQGDDRVYTDEDDNPACGPGYIYGENKPYFLENLTVLIANPLVEVEETELSIIARWHGEVRRASL